jgi:hypothetical protein
MARPALARFWLGQLGLAILARLALLGWQSLVVKQPMIALGDLAQTGLFLFVWSYADYSQGKYTTLCVVACRFAIQIANVNAP